jgi:hypothetical protein
MFVCTSFPRVIHGLTELYLPGIPSFLGAASAPSEAVGIGINSPVRSLEEINKKNTLRFLKHCEAYTSDYNLIH